MRSCRRWRARARRCTCRSPARASLSADPAPRANTWTAIGLALTFAGPLLLASPFAQVLYEQTGDAAAAVGQLALAGLCLLVLVVLRWGEYAPLSTIGLIRPRWRPVLQGAGIGIGVYAVLAVVAIGLSRLGAFDNKAATEAVLAWPLSLRVVVAAAAGVIEETLYRGYAIERLTALTGRRRLSAAIAVAAFAAAHVPFWGWGAVITPLAGGAFFAALYLWRRDLVLCMSAHSTIDLIGLVVLPALMTVSAG